MKSRVKKLGDFDVDAFVEWIDLQRSKMPTDIALLYLFLDRVSEQRLQNQPKPDEWDSLDIDWSKFHPDARGLLDDRFFWDPVDELAPHGNDEGADVLSALQRLDPQERINNSAEILQSILASWEVESKGDQFIATVFERAREDALIGMAFALIKLDGQCPPSIRDEALSVLERRGDEGGRMALLTSALRR